VTLRRAAVPATLTLLILLSLLFRTSQLGASFWIDEGLSVGIAHHHWTSIPGILNQDGSPPAYYLLLGLWIRLFGDGEQATHTLSLLFGLGCIPVAFFAARSLFGQRAAFIAAVLAAFDPFLTYYAQETRMYELEAFLSLLVAWGYVNGVLRGRTWWAVGLVPAIALMVYTHNWALFFCVGLAVATVAVARERLKLFAIVAGGVALLYLPWVPTVLGQIRHTGAPWSSSPSLHQLINAPGAVLGGDATLVAIVLAAGGALIARVRDRIILSLLVMVEVTVLCAWLSSQVSPAWTTRYFAVVLGPVLLLAARGFDRAGRLGVAGLAVVLFLWSGYNLHNDKEDAQQVAAGVSQYMHPGELVVSTHPEQVPVLRYYLGPGYRFRTTLGAVPDQQIFDWRDAVDRLTDSNLRQQADAAVAATPVGGEFVVISPVFRDYRAWDAKWTKLVWQTSTAYTALLAGDPRLRLVHHVVPNEIALQRNYFKPMQAFVYRRLR
jgi:mannosyltransferase